MAATPIHINHFPRTRSPKTYSTMISTYTRLARPLASRALHTTTRASAAGKDPRLSQGHAASPDQEADSTQSDSAQAGLKTSQEVESGMDVAAKGGVNKAPRSKGDKGNREGVGMAEQVGSASGSAHGGGTAVKGGQEEAASPGIMGVVKNALGLGTTAGEVKQNRGGGRGVKGTGTLPFSKRELHTSPVAMYVGDKTTVTGEAGDGARLPKDDTLADQNDHLQHKEKGEADGGQGNAAEDPVLPSKRKEGKEDGRLPSRGNDGRGADN